MDKAERDRTISALQKVLEKLESTYNSASSGRIRGFLGKEIARIKLEIDALRKEI